MHDIVIIGAGPIGIELAVELKKQNYNYAHFEAGQIGSTIEWYSPGTRFFSSPERIAITGVPLVTERQEKATREEYLRYLRAVVTQFELEINTFQRVTTIKKEADGFLVTVERSAHGVGGAMELSYTPSGDTLSQAKAKKVVLTIGDMHTPKMLNIPGEDLPHVSHYFEEVHKYYGKKVVIVGGKNSAIEAAIRLYRLGAEVTVCYRGKEISKDRIKYWLYPEFQHLVKKNYIRFMPELSPIEITDTHVHFGDSHVEADFVLLLTGYKQDSSLFTQLGITLKGESKAPEYSRKTMETDVPGVYVAGTAIAGTQLAGVKEFIETSHVHVARIMAHLTGSKEPLNAHPGELDFLEN